VVLSQAKILDTAFDLLVTNGLADLSMRRLAAELQVAPGALYYHVKNKQHLLVLLANYILDKKAPKELLMPADSKDPEAVKESLIVRGQVLFETIYSIPEFPEVIRLALATNPERLKPVAAIAYDAQNMGVEPGAGRTWTTRVETSSGQRSTSSGYPFRRAGSSGDSLSSPRCATRDTSSSISSCSRS